MATLKSSRDFWDRKAAENPYWYISSYRAYGNPDPAEFWESGRLIWEEIKAALGYEPHGNDVVVEIGCGLGRVTRAIAPVVGRVHAFDISAAMLEHAAEAGPPNVIYHLTRGDTLAPLGDGVAQLVLAYQVFQHLPDEQVLARYLREMVRVAAPGGLIALTTAPVDWRARCLPLLRLRALILGGLRGPRELGRKEWVGIRPSVTRMRALSPVPLERRILPGGRWLYFGRVR